MSGNGIQRQRETFAYRFAAAVVSEEDWRVPDGEEELGQDFGPAAQNLTERLQGEFDQWASANDITKHPLEEEELPGLRRGPIGHWPYIENFLKDNYPAAHRGLQYGMETAQPLMDGYSKLYNKPVEDRWVGLNGGTYQTGPEAVAQHGYDPKEIAAAFLYLHNRSHAFRNTDEWIDQDVDRLFDIFQKRMKMQRNYEQRQANSYRYANDLVKEYTDQLYDEFHDWAREQEYVPVGFEKNDPRVINPDYTKQMNGPLSYWDNIEGFLKDRYPAAHRDYRYGEENASDALDGRTLRMPARYSPWPNRTWHPPYETGPEAIEKYGYDPRQVAAGFMYLHTWSHAQSPQNKWRGDKLPRDIDRLAEIFQKRQQMQRNYEQRQAQ